MVAPHGGVDTAVSEPLAQLEGRGPRQAGIESAGVPEVVMARVQSPTPSLATDTEMWSPVTAKVPPEGIGNQEVNHVNEPTP